MDKRFIVYEAKEHDGYYYFTKKSNSVSDIIAIVKTEDKAKELVSKDSNHRDYKEIDWEE